MPVGLLGLPVEIIQQILLNADSYLDYVALRSTCRKCYDVTLGDSFKARRLPLDVAGLVQRHRERILQGYRYVLEKTHAEGWMWEQQLTGLYGRLGWRYRLRGPVSALSQDSPATFDFVDGTRPPVNEQRRKNALHGIRKAMARSVRLPLKQTPALPRDFAELLSQTNGLESYATVDRYHQPCGLLVRGVARRGLLQSFNIVNQVLRFGPIWTSNPVASKFVNVPFPVKYAFQLGDSPWSLFVNTYWWTTVYAFCKVDDDAQFSWKVIHCIGTDNSGKPPPKEIVVFDDLVHWLRTMLKENVMCPSEWIDGCLEYIHQSFWWGEEYACYAPPPA